VPSNQTLVLVLDDESGESTEESNVTGIGRGESEVERLG